MESTVLILMFYWSWYRIVWLFIIIWVFICCLGIVWIMRWIMFVCFWGWLSCRRILVLVLSYLVVFMNFFIILPRGCYSQVFWIVYGPILAHNHFYHNCYYVQIHPPHNTYAKFPSPYAQDAEPKPPTA